MARKPARRKAVRASLNFVSLVEVVRQVHEQSAAAASRAVNLSLTLRNWLTGHYIVEYEQHGADRAKYGEGLLEKLARALAERGIVEISARSLRLYRQFFLAYPRIWQSAIAKSGGNVVPSPIWRPLIAKSGARSGLPAATIPKSRAPRQLGVDGFVDLVFYHRILKCHVLIELKVDEFRHEHLGQLNTYVTWYRKHMLAEGDNPPVGLLLCTQKDHALVEYALAAIDSRLFVSKYQLELPSKEDLQRFLEEKRREMGDHG